MAFETFFTTICAVIVAAYGLYKGIIEIMANSKSGKEKREAELQKQKEERIKEVQDAVKPMLQEVDDKIENIKSNLNDHIKENNIQNATTRRVRILRNSDDLLNQNMNWPSESAFEQMIDDCSQYEKFAAANLDYKNGIADEAIAIIRESYKRAKREDLFGERKVDF